MKHSNSGMETIRYALKDKPVITTIVSDDDLEQTLKTNSNTVFLLTGNLFTLPSITEQIKDAGKLIFVHFDLVEGLGRDSESVRYLAEVIGVDGIVTTRTNTIAAAKKCSLMTVQRLFVFDSVSLDNGIKMIQNAKPDAIEVLPGIVVPRVFKKIQQKIEIPTIAGGLLHSREDVEMVLQAGAIGVSTSTKELWDWQDKNM